MSNVDGKTAATAAAATTADAAVAVAKPAPPQPKGLETASFISRWSFWWLNGLLTTGFRRALQTDDVPPLPSTERAFDNAQRFESILHRVYAKFQPGSKSTAAEGDAAASAAAAAPGAQQQPPSLAWAIYQLVGPAYLSALCFQFVSEVLAFAGPVLVQRITGFLEEDSTEPTSNGWIYTALLFALPTIASVCRNQYHLSSWRVAVRLRSAILSSVFRKSLKLSPAARRIVTDGEILTLMSADAQKLADIWNLLFVLFTAPLSIFACFVLIWLQVGASTLAGAGVILVLMPMNIWLGKVSGSYRREEAAFTDLRMRYVKEAVSNMKVIKQYGWSDSFSDRITTVRRSEIKIRRKAAYMEAFSNSILILTPVLISLVTFLTFAGSGHVLTATNVFTSMALFNVMRFQLSQFPLVLTALFEARISLQRILRLFLREELQQESRDFAEEIPEQSQGQPKPEVIRIENASFSWDVTEQGSAAAAAAAQSTAIVPASAAAAASSPAKPGAPRVPNAGGVDSNWRLSDVTLSVRRGQFVAVVGAVGSGKSSLLAAILGEVARTSGPRVFFRGRVAIVPQTAWILNATLRDNILFGLAKDEERYQRVIDLCCLRADLAQLTAGDSTEIGDRGVNVSGGQRQRIAVARAVYAALSGTVDTILLDDPLSAVDAHVSKALFDRVLCRTGILGKLGVTTILAMNQLHFLPGTDWVVVLKHGRVVQSNTYAHLMLEPQGELAQLMSSYGFEQDEEHKEEAGAAGEKTKKLGGSASSARSASSASAAVVPLPAPVPVGAQPISPGAVAGSQAVGSSAASGPADGSQTLTTAPLVSPTKAGSNLPVAPAHATAKAGDASAAGAAVPAKKGGTITQAEGRVEGSVGFKVYAAYIRASGGWWVLWSILFLFCVHQGGRVGADFWLAAWASQDWSAPKHKLAFWMGIFAAFGAAVTVASLIRSMLFAEKTLAAAYNLHQSMLACIFRSPAAWFDVTPVGRIVNRFSADCDKLDHLLGRTLEGYGGCVFFVLGTFVAICVVYPFYFAPLLFIIFVYWKVQQYYVASSRELQRLDSISKSPIFSNFGESLQGAPSIRAYGARERFLRANEKYVDANSRNLLAYQAALCWLAVRIEFISTLLMTISSIFAVSSRRDTNAALAGLTIVYAITITSFLNFSVRLGSVVEGLMSSVERLDEYSQLTPEAAPRLPGVDPPASWPSRGEIQLESISMRYRPELDLVLKGVSCSIAPGEKIGIIGRTGSGKSSLMVALFRLVELTSGRVLIDGVDIGKIGLESLRTKITLIPQEPVLFGGTVKYNLDPFDHCSEQQIWRALQQVNLADKIRSMDGGLNFVLSEGESLSVGERQLLCVCRALLRETKILVLDEATASVDIESDNLIQTVLASHFASATVLAIAHRLSSIINYDKILVMDAGEVAEFGVPHVLLQNPRSALLSLVDATGPASATYLKAVAKQTYIDKQRGIKVKFGMLPSADSFGADGQQLTTGDPVEVSAVRWHDQEDGEN